MFVRYYDTVWWIPGILYGKITGYDVVCWWFAGAVFACLMIAPIDCREASDPAGNGHIIYCKPHGVKTLQPEATLHGRLRAAGNNLVNAFLLTTALSEPCLYKVVPLLLRSMGCSQFVTDITSRTDSGTTICLQAIAPR